MHVSDHRSTAVHRIPQGNPSPGVGWDSFRTDDRVNYSRRRRRRSKNSRKRKQIAKEFGEKYFHVHARVWWRSRSKSLVCYVPAPYLSFTRSNPVRHIFMPFSPANEIRRERKAFCGRYRSKYQNDGGIAKEEFKKCFKRRGIKDRISVLILSDSTLNEIEVNKNNNYHFAQNSAVSLWYVLSRYRIWLWVYKLFHVKTNIN